MARTKLHSDPGSDNNQSKTEGGKSEADRTRQPGLTPAQREFAEMLGPILAKRWKAAGQLKVRSAAGEHLQ
jgi:hypothetical protein